MLRYLNGFILIGAILLVLSVAGLASSNRILTEPGQSPNPYSWLLYLAAAAIMFVNGVVSVHTARRAHDEAEARKANVDAAPTKD